MAPMTDSLSPCANTATKATRPMPIISAAAVDAVRDGLRVAFCRARLPEAPGRRSSGQPMTRARNGTAYRLRPAIARNTSSAPRAMVSRRCVAAASDDSARTMMTMPTTASRPAKAGANREMRDRGISAPSRRAATGGTRLARSAGMSAATTLTITPTSSAVMAMPIENCVDATGMPPGSSALNTHTSRAANP